MTNDKGILIKNIYYMLAYAFQVLKQTSYEEIAAEEFEEIQDLFAAIIARGVGRQLKQGLFREYIEKKETLNTLRGKIDMAETIHNKVQHKHVISCEYDELSENNLYNQIIKTASEVLVRSSGVKPENKKILKKNLLLFGNVDTLEPSQINWKSIRIRRNNKNYEMLLNVCYFVLDGMLQSTDEGKYRMAQFADEHMERLYEKFVLEYYRLHHKELSANAIEIKWDLSEGDDEDAIKFLPHMQTDITLKNKRHTLIIDTKYYKNTMQKRFDSYSYHSANMYQIFTYVKNYDTSSQGDVSGMLLYAKTGESITPDGEYMISGNNIAIKTLDLNCEFAEIKAQLDSIADGYFPNCTTVAVP